MPGIHLLLHFFLQGSETRKFAVVAAQICKRKIVGLANTETFPFTVYMHAVLRRRCFLSVHNSQPFGFHSHSTRDELSFELSFLRSHCCITPAAAFLWRNVSRSGHTRKKSPEASSPHGTRCDLISVSFLPSRPINKGIKTRRKYLRLPRWHLSSRRGNFPQCT